MFFFILLITFSFAQEKQFKSWLKQHNKIYANKAEYLYRLAVFMDNKKFVEKTPNTELNVFADMTHEEFVKTHLGMTYHVPEVSTVEKQETLKQAPTSLDYRSKMNAAKDQGSCGSCWSFCTTAVLEGKVNIDLGTLKQFSEQQLVDCDSYDSACDGGHPQYAFQFIKENGGLTYEANYPYTEKQGTCKSVSNKYTVTGYKRVTDGSETNLQTLLYENGPIAVGMDASPVAFQLYSAGTIFSNDNCRTLIMNHCVTLVGYGSNSSGDYWIIRNSWGTSWGDAGHFLLARNANNMCGIGRDSTYPTGVKAV